MSTGTIQGSFGWDNAPFVQGMAEAERVASRGAGNIQGKIAGIFKRGPNVRAERAFSGLFERVAAGDIAGGIEQISNRMTGLGLIAGVAVAAGVAVFVKFKQEIDATKQAHAALQEEMLKRPVSLVASMSSEGMAQALETRQKLAADLRKKQESSFGSEVWAGLTTTGRTLPFMGGVEKSEQERIRTQMDLNKAGMETKAIEMAQTDLLERQIQIKRMALTGDERGAKVAEIVLETQEQISALQSKGLSHAAFAPAKAAIEEEGQFKIDKVNQGMDLLAQTKDRSFETSKKVLELDRSDLSVTQKKAAAAALELGAAKRGLENPNLTVDERRALILQKMKKEGELNIMPDTVAPLSGEWWRRKGAGESRDAEEALGKVGLTQADITKYKGASGDYPGSDKGSPDVVAAVNAMNKTMEKAWGN
jgi:hypothetical protein